MKRTPIYQVLDFIAKYCVSSIQSQGLCCSWVQQGTETGKREYTWGYNPKGVH